LAVPGLLALVAAIPASRSPTTAPAHAAIRAAVAARAASPGLTVYDPLDGAPVVLPPNTPDSFVVEHFSRQEWAAYGSVGGLRVFLCSRLAVWLSLVAGILALMVYSGVEAVTTLGCLVLSALFVLVPWDAVRTHDTPPGVHQNLPLGLQQFSPPPLHQDPPLALQRTRRSPCNKTRRSPHNKTRRSAFNNTRRSPYNKTRRSPSSAIRPPSL
jgi:hypothetical protein